MVPKSSGRRVVSMMQSTESRNCNKRWFPSYAILADGRIVSDRNLFIAIEQLPKGLSLGIRRETI